MSVNSHSLTSRFFNSGHASKITSKVLVRSALSGRWSVSNDCPTVFTHSDKTQSICSCSKGPQSAPSSPTLRNCGVVFTPIILAVSRYQDTRPRYSRIQQFAPQFRLKCQRWSGFSSGMFLHASRNLKTSTSL
ncbi:hypothetical protein F442_05250 [Phytophthora nicotianae P10297]|uniref:Uncharacterized protein n=5 Tax=Phytophthora nicotianae TaxID=4792 RepID=W2QFM8_PHYN3|nr:hypothetical protein PPTG_22518 [Phytophthora nicotianae INRA-310]ETI51438.1 hypothetical protein F443_05202 [Phytophthora nicotianae P1569]ETL44721.1 hypothetical protein L916_05024 [Phytophthora nicotianae]ETO80191.1 hypothetical protein F444_05234 [Phytophthora nicotianae P1976]ETP49142.1 hypothetical protein F442_05250 [Phytophthora nicotianae P10297]ETL97892.1 hypothetical protein L917_04907 [Phytophthora nicotianae]